MKSILVLVMMSLSLVASAEDKKPPTLKSILLEQLRTTHNAKDWFVDANGAVAGLTPEQASWKDGSGNHSVGQLTYHLVFWNKRELAKFKGEPETKFDGNNEQTFDKFDSKQWTSLVQQLDQVMVDLGESCRRGRREAIAVVGFRIAHIGTHNAYHVGQIVFVRKLQGSWDPEKGVK